MERLAFALEEEVEVRNVGFLVSGFQRSVTWEAGGLDSVWTLPSNCLVTLLRPSPLQVTSSGPGHLEFLVLACGFCLLHRDSLWGRNPVPAECDNTEELSPVPSLECVLSNGWQCCYCGHGYGKLTVLAIWRNWGYCPHPGASWPISSHTNDKSLGETQLCGRTHSPRAWRTEIL